MNRYDQLVNDFLLSRFRDSWKDTRWHLCWLPSTKQRAIKHQLTCDSSRARLDHCEWGCSCLSEYTQEDMFNVVYTVSCDCGAYFSFTERFVGNGEPVMEQLEEYESTWECSYDEA